VPLEDLTSEGYLATGALRGEPYGDFEMLRLGQTPVSELVSVGLTALVPTAIDFPFTRYRPPQRPSAVKPDRVYMRREGTVVLPVAVEEWKPPRNLRTPEQQIAAAEQALYGALALGVHVGVVSGGSGTKFVDVQASSAAGELCYFDERRDMNPGVLSNLLAGDAGVLRDPKPLAESVWQIIWHATKAEPKECLLTFVEMFMLKFLSDNLPASKLPQDYSFYRLIEPADQFQQRTGKTAIEYYVSDIRPRIKTLFPDNVVARDAEVPALFGLQTMVSKTSIINGFAFLRSSQQSLASFDRTFRQILDAFQAFGPLTAIDPEFKLRLYETFLRRSARQQRLGQFFTPRNIVRPMVRMAQLDTLAEGSVVLDPAAGVGGFLLEPLLFTDALKDNVTFASGLPRRRVRTIGVDIDTDLHILGKANALIHLAEAVRDPATSMEGLNALLADTLVLMNDNETLGSLLNPPTDSVDVILTNPPYVTQGSAIYRSELRELRGTRNGLDLRDYYEGSGLGVESLFMRYISGALKPGGRAFVIVPLGLLNRTEAGPKKKLLDECNLLASIQLPRNAFFNTAQPTCILVMERRRTAVDERPPVMCGIARSTGETLDYERVPTPEENDLADIAEAFVKYSRGESLGELPVVRIVDAENFGKDERWDVTRFWTDAELVELGERAPAVPRLTFIEELSASLTELQEDLLAAQREFESLTSGEMVDLQLWNPDADADNQLFRVQSGTRVTNAQLRDHPGDVPVYSCFTDARSLKGTVDAQWLSQQGISVLDAKSATVNANGASGVGIVFVREPGCLLTDDVIAVTPLSASIDPEYLAVALASSVAAGGYLYEAKLFVRRVRALSIQVPVDADGHLDLEQQRAIAAAAKRLDTIRQRVTELGRYTKSARIS
jgi:type I restriction enzyme M protein